MAYRKFTDARGQSWQAWDVVPHSTERRTIGRRHTQQTTRHPERRALVDRRVSSGTRTLCNDGMGDGWLCFECEDEKRRLAPIPQDWEGCAPERLEQYCAIAPRAQRATGQHRRAR